MSLMYEFLHSQGQTRPCTHLGSTSGLTESGRPARCRIVGGEVSFAPPFRCTSFDHLVGAGVQGFRHGKAERLRRLEIDHQCELGWHLYRQVSWPLTLEDTIDVASRSPVIVPQIDSKREQPALRDEKTRSIDRGQSVPRSERNDQLAMKEHRRVLRHDQSTVWFARECSHVLLDLA